MSIAAAFVLPEFSLIFQSEALKEKTVATKDKRQNGELAVADKSAVLLLGGGETQVAGLHARLSAPIRLTQNSGRSTGCVMSLFTTRGQ